MSAVELLIHLESISPENGGGFVWWAESPELPGFTASADHLPELIEKSRVAVSELLGEGEVTVVPQLVADEDESAAPSDPVPNAERAAQGPVETRGIRRALVSA